MKHYLGFFSFTLLAASLLSCATEGKYQEKLVTWEGKDADSLVKAWGEPDSREKLRNGDRVFVYARLRHEEVAFKNSSRAIASETQPGSTPTAPSVYIKCSNYFTINTQDKITHVMFRGDECKSRD
jgi:hypothetical protein